MRTVPSSFSPEPTAAGLVITNDDKGIKAKPERGSGMGLHIMDYRARSIGGSLSIRGDEGGTIVLCRVPLRAKAESEQK